MPNAIETIILTSATSDEAFTAIEAAYLASTGARDRHHTIELIREALFFTAYDPKKVAIAELMLKRIEEGKEISSPLNSALEKMINSAVAEIGREFAAVLVAGPEAKVLAYLQNQFEIVPPSLHRHFCYTLLVDSLLSHLDRVDPSTFFESFYFIGTRYPAFDNHKSSIEDRYTIIHSYLPIYRHDARRAFMHFYTALLPDQKIKWLYRFFQDKTERLMLTLEPTENHVSLLLEYLAERAEKLQDLIDPAAKKIELDQIIDMLGLINTKELNTPRKTLDIKKTVGGFTTDYITRSLNSKTTFCQYLQLTNTLLDQGADFDLVYTRFIGPVGAGMMHVIEHRAEFSDGDFLDLNRRYLALINRFYDLYKRFKPADFSKPFTRVPSPSYVSAMLALESVGEAYLDLLLQLYRDGKFSDEQMSEIFNVELCASLINRIPIVFKMLKELNLSESQLEALGIVELRSTDSSGKPETLKVRLFNYMQSKEMLPEERIALYEPLLDETNNSQLARFFRAQPGISHASGALDAIRKTVNDCHYEIKINEGKREAESVYRDITRVLPAGEMPPIVKWAAKTVPARDQQGRACSISMKQAVLNHMKTLPLDETIGLYLGILRGTKDALRPDTATRFFWAAPSTPGLFGALRGEPDQIKQIRVIAQKYDAEHRSFSAAKARR